MFLEMDVDLREYTNGPEIENYQKIQIKSIQTL